MPVHLLRVPPLWLLRHPRRHRHLALRLRRHCCSHCLQLLPARLLRVSLCGCSAPDTARFCLVHATLGRACCTQAYADGPSGAHPGWVSRSVHACCICWRSTHHSKHSVRLPSAEENALNTALPCCRFMCTPHWQLFYLGVSTLLGGQGSGPQLSNTNLCGSLLLWSLDIKHMPGRRSSGLMQDSCPIQHHICIAVPSLKHAAAPHLKCLL